MNIDLNEWDFRYPEKKLQELIPDGTYDLRIIDVIYGYKNYKYVNFKFKVIDHETTAHFILTFNPHKQDVVNEIIFSMAESFGIDEEDIDITDFESWIGKTGRAYLERQEFKYGSSYLVKKFKGHVNYSDNSNIEDDLKFEIGQLAWNAYVDLGFVEDAIGETDDLYFAQMKLREIIELVDYDYEFYNYMSQLNEY